MTFPGKENEGKSYFVDPGSVTCAILKEGVKSGLGQAVEASFNSFSELNNYFSQCI